MNRWSSFSPEGSTCALLCPVNMSREKKKKKKSCSWCNPSPILPPGLYSILFLSLSAAPTACLQTCVSPVAIVRVDAGPSVQAGVGGVGGAHVVAELPGGAAAHGRGRHLHRHQGQSARVHQGRRVADAQLRVAAARPLAVGARARVHLHLAHVQAQLRLELQGRGREDGRLSGKDV